MTDTTESNRALITKAFEGLRHGDPSHFLPLFDEDIDWRVMGSSAWSKHARGLANVERELVGPLFARFAGPYLNIPELILADVVGPGDDFGLGESGGQEKEEEETEHESEKWVGFLGTANQANERESWRGCGELERWRGKPRKWRKGRKGCGTFCEAPGSLWLCVSSGF